MSKGPLFDILNAIDVGDSGAYKKYEKDYNPYMIMKWMAACKDPSRIILVNELLNTNVFRLSKEKELLFYLSCAISDGEKKRYKWIKRLKNKDKSSIEVVSQYYDITKREARISLSVFNNDDIIEMAQELGYTDKELKTLKKSLNDT